MSAVAVLREGRKLLDQLKKDNSIQLSFYEGIPHINGKSLFPFKYRIYQKKILDGLEAGNKRYFLHWPRRAGKDAFCFTYLIACALKKRGIYYYVLPTKVDAEGIIWDGGVNTPEYFYYFKDLFPEPLVKQMNAKSLKIKLKNGSIINLAGSNFYNKLRGKPCHGVIFSEFAFGDTPEGLDVMIPTINQSKGFIIINTTPNGYNFSWQKFMQFKSNPAWNCSLETALTLLDENGNRYITDQDIQNAINDGLSPGKIKQEFFCEPLLDTDTLYFAHEMKLIEEEGRLRDETLIPKRPMYFAADLGLDTTAIIGFQVNNVGHPIISYYYENVNKTLDFYWNEVSSYVNKKGLAMATWFLPHDGAKRNLTDKNNPLNVIKSFGARVHHLQRPTKLGLNSSIENAKIILRNTVINRKECSRLIEALSSYGRKFNQETKTYDLYPRHDWASHPSDAFQYLSMACNEGMTRQQAPRISSYSL